VFLIERHVTDLRGRHVSAIAALSVASLRARAGGQADAASLAHYIREQWSIKSLHWIRDTLVGLTLAELIADDD
jgi:hypothetical protein